MPKARWVPPKMKSYTRKFKRVDGGAKKKDVVKEAKKDPTKAIVKEEASETG